MIKILQHKVIAFFLLFFSQISVLFALDDFSVSVANQASSATDYNIAVVTAVNGPLTGGILVVGENLVNNAGTENGSGNEGSYYLEVSWGSGFNPFNGEGNNNGNSSNGNGSYGNGEFKGYRGGDNIIRCQLYFSHEDLANTAGYPGNIEGATVTFRLNNDEIAGASGNSDYNKNWDLVAPTLQTISIASNNSNAAFAKAGDVVTISLASATSANLGNAARWISTIQDQTGTINISSTNATITTTVGNGHADGPCTFSFRIYDDRGNPSPSYFSDVIGSSAVTIDKTDPVVTVGISSNNATSSLSKEDDLITVTIDAGGEVINVPTVTISSNNATESPGSAADNFTATYQMGSGETQGAIAVAVTNISDRAGNTANDVGVTNSSQVIHDSVIPTLAIVRMYSNNSNTAYAKSGDVVTVRIQSTSAEPLQTPLGTIDGAATGENQNGNNYDYLITKTMNPSVNEGDLGFTVDFKDLAGNSGSQITSTIGGSGVIFDDTAPSDSRTFISTNSNNNKLATTGDVIQISVAADNNLKVIGGVSSATINGITVPDGGITRNNGTSWTVGYTLDGTEAAGYAQYAYVLTDLAGNTTSLSGATDVRIDNTAPTLPTVEIVSNNSNPIYAKVSDRVTVTIVANEDLIAAPTVNLAGRAATVDAGADDQNWTAYIDMNSSDTEGDVAISIAYINDLGVSGITQTSTTNSIDVTFDRTPPTLNPIQITSNNANTDYAKEGDLVTLSFNSNEFLIDDPTVVFLATPGDNLNANESGTNDTWSASFTMANGNTEGNIDFTVDYFDLAGNAGLQKTTTTNSSTVEYDETAPTLQDVTIASNNSDPTKAKQDDIITLSIISSGNIQAPDVTIAAGDMTINSLVALASGSSGGTSYTYTYTMQSTDGTAAAIAFTVDFKDLANNSGIQVTSLANDADGGVAFDKDKPAVSSVTITSNNTNRSGATSGTGLAIVGDEVTVTLEINEVILVADKPTVTIAGNNASVSRTTSGPPSQFDATYTMASGDAGYDGATLPIVISNYKDAAGNVGENATVATDGSTVTFDLSAPTLGSVAIQSDNLTSTLAKSGDAITLTFVSNENLTATPVATFLGNTATMTAVGDSSNWSATNTVSGASSAGVVGFTIGFTDQAGNNGSSVTALSGANPSVVVDITSPDLQSVNMYSDNSTGDELSVPDDIVTVAFVTDTDIQTPIVTIATQAATVAMAAGSPDSWVATYRMTEAEAAGSVPLTISFQDLAGNIGTGSPYSALLLDADGNRVNFDKSKPSLNSLAIFTDNSAYTDWGRVGSVVSLVFGADETLDPSQNVVAINGNAVSASFDAAAGTHGRYTAVYALQNSDIEQQVTFSVDFIDMNGYAGETAVNVTLDGTIVTFDNTIPSITTLTYASNNAIDVTKVKQTELITIDITSPDLLQEPVILVAGQSPGTPVVVGNAQTWTSIYTVPNLSDGLVTLQLDFKDYAGNSGTRLTAPTDGIAINYDSTIPRLDIVTLVSNNNYSTAKAKLFDELTLSIDADELLSTPVITISNISVTPIMGLTADLWVATYTMQVADTEADVPFTIDFTDLANNPGGRVTSTTDGLVVNYDNTAPLTTGLVVDLKDASDTGLLNSDNITTVLTPVFEIQNLTSGPALAAGEKLILNIDGVDYDSLTITVDAMSIAVPGANPLANNVLPYQITAYIRDLAGNLSLASTPLSLIVDTEAPLTNGVLNLIDLSDTGLDNTDEITSDNTPTLQVNGLADGQIYTVQIEYDLEGGATNQLVINQLMAQAVTDQFTTTALSDGVYTFTYKLVDTAGNISLESDPIVITIDRTQPTIPTAPDLTDAYDTGTLNSDNLTNLQSLEFSISNLVIGEILEVYDNAGGLIFGPYLQTITATTETIVIPSFSEQPHAIYATVTDLAGNQCGETGRLDLIVDLTAIDVTSITIDLNTSDDSGTETDDNVTNDNTPTFTFATVSLNDIVSLYDTANLGGNIVGTATSTGTSVSVTSSTLVDNPYTMSFTVTDYAGNVSLLSSNQLPILIDTTPWGILKDLVLITDTGPEAGDNHTNDQTPEFLIPSDLDFAELDMIRLYSNNGISNTLIVSEQKLASTTFHSITVPNASALGEGSYDFTYDIVDFAGNVSLATSAALTITVDVTPPLYTLSSVDLDDATDSGGDPLDATDPLTIDNLTNSSNLSVTLSGFTANDYAQLSYSYVDGVAAPVNNIVEANGLVSAGDAGTKTYSFPHIGDGVYTISGFSADLAGNQNTGVTLVVTVDTTPPDASLVTLDLEDASDTGGDPLNGADPLTIDNITNATTPNIIISGVSVADSVILYNDDVNNSVKARGLPAASTITLAQDLTAAADAAITFTATLKDAAGNESVAAPPVLYMTLDTTPPLSGTTPPLPDLTDATDTGEFPTDNKTYLQNPNFNLTLTGAFEPDSLILYAQTGITKSIVGRSIKNLNEEFGTIAVATGKELTEAADYTITYKLIDAAGNVSAESDPLTPLVVDITYPAIPGDPNLEPLYDTGKSNSDNITNAATIAIDLPGIVAGAVGVDPGIGKLYTFTDVNGDGIFDYDDYGPDGIQATSDFGEGNNAYDEGEPSTESPVAVIADYSNNNANFENWYLNDWAASGNDADCGCLDGSLTYNYSTVAEDSIAISFFTIHEDLVGQRTQSANALTVFADRKIPDQQVTVAYSDSDFLVSALTGILKYTFTYFEELDSQDNPPRIDIRFPGDSPTLENQPLVYTGVDNIWEYDLDLSSYGSENGILSALDHNAKDLAGNNIPEPVWETVIIDNLPADFTDITPEASSFSNVLNNFGWTLNESLDPAAVNVINFYQDNAVVTSYDMVVSEYSSGPRAPGDLGVGFSLADGLYTVSFETTDIVGNVGKTDIIDYTYDTKNPSVAMTYTREVITADSMVTIIATFDEPVTTPPNLTLTAMDSLVLGSNSISVPMVLPGGCECLDDNGDVIPNCEPAIDEATCIDINGFNGTWDPDYYGVIDKTLWIYHYIAPGVDEVNLSITNSGKVNVWIGATDLATNQLYMLANVGSGIESGFQNEVPVYIDNDKTQPTYTYVNVSNDTIIDALGNPTTFAGAGGDTIEVTVTLNQPILTTGPVPELRYTYGSGAGNGLSGITFVSVADIEDGIEPDAIDALTEANRLWKWNLVIPDLVEWDGNIDFNLIARDLSNVFILEENEITDASFVVDNIHPAAFETGIVTVAGENPVQGWITSFIDVIKVNVPIPSQIEDQTIINGRVKVEFYNLNRGVEWVKVGPNDLITEIGTLDFSRNVVDVYAGMVQGVDIITGDQISVRASLIDRNGNTTIGTESVTLFAYDPTAPAMGSVTGGNFLGEDTTQIQYSNDLVNLEWSAFLESDAGESGVEKYEILVRKLANGDCNCLDVDGNIIADCETTVDYTTCVSSLADSGFASFWTVNNIVTDQIADSTLIDWTIVTPPSQSFSYQPVLEHNKKYRAFVRATDVAGNISRTLKSDILYRRNSAPVISLLEAATLNEDFYWSDTLTFTDLDLDIQQGDQFTYEVITNLQEGAIAYLETGTAQGGSVSGITLSTTASPQNDFYNGTIVKLVDELEDSLRTILDYDGASKIATISEGLNDWTSPPTIGDTYEISRGSVSIKSYVPDEGDSGNERYAILSWKPSQVDVNNYNLSIRVTDDYALADTLPLALLVNPVNDPPNFIIESPHNSIEWTEDQTILSPVTLNLNNHIYDVDNDISTEMAWQAVIYDTSQSDQDFPYGQVVIGPGTSKGRHAGLLKEYIGFDIYRFDSKKNSISQRTLELMNSTSIDPLLSVSIDNVASENGGVDIVASFSSAANYYGANHRIEFIVQDLSGAEKRDTVIVTVLPENDPPQIAELENKFVSENDSIKLEFGSFATDIDDTSLTFTIEAFRVNRQTGVVIQDENGLPVVQDSITITPSVFTSNSILDSVIFTPDKLWSHKALIQVTVSDEETSANSSFTLDIDRVLRPHLTVSLIQNTAFSRFLQVIVTDTASKATRLSMEIQNQDVVMDTIAEHTYVSNLSFESSGNYSVDIFANASVGDTSINEFFALVAGKAATRWVGRSFDGRFGISGDPGAVTYDQPFLIADSTLFEETFHDQASYLFGSEDLTFNKPIEVRLRSEREDLAIYRRKNGVIWEELPSLTLEKEIFTLTNQAGYFKLGPKTIIVPEKTSIHQNYPNPFNPTTTIKYDIGLMDGLSQNVSIDIYNLLGQHVKSLIKNVDHIGQYTIQWNGQDSFGQQMSSGVYFVQLATKTGIIKNKKMMLLK